jgi:GAF domain-containing protein
VLDYLVSALNLGFGLFLVRRLPGQRVAALLGLGMVGAATSFNAHAHSALLSSSLAYSTALNDLHLALHIASGAAYLDALLLFPDGTPALRGADWLLAALVAGAVGSILLLHTDALFFVVLFGFLIPSVGLVALAARIRRTTDPRARQQIGVVAWALVLVLASALILLVLVFGPGIAGRPAVVTASLEQVEYVALELFSILFALIPIALFIGIVRYQLFDIRLLARTLVYGTLTTSIVGLYALIVGALDVLFGTGNSVPVSLVAAGSIAVLFQPLRERLQHSARRLVYGERDEPYRVLARLGRRLEATLSPDAVLPTIVQTVREALELPSVSIVLQGEPVAVSGVEAETSLRLPLVYQQELLGELRLAPRSPGEPFSTADRQLLEALARQAGAAVHAVRLTADLQRARERLVSAREEERRRLRRDLHDGLGPTLAGVPVLALPVETDGPLPAGVQLVGPFGRDKLVVLAGLGSLGLVRS